jgi:hypothetical protein
MKFLEYLSLLLRAAGDCEGDMRRVGRGSIKEREW